MPAKPSRDKPDQRPMVRLVSGLPSGSFAFVMATGIVSIAAELLGFRRSASHKGQFIENRFHFSWNQYISVCPGVPGHRGCVAELAHAFFMFHLPFEPRVRLPHFPSR
jgi:hypothetical protein